MLLSGTYEFFSHSLRKRDERSPKSESGPFFDRLNERQRAAYVAAVMQPVSLVSGPPGTGKTRFIATLTQDVLAKQPEGWGMFVSIKHICVTRQGCGFVDPTV